MSQDFGRAEQKNVLHSFKTASLIATYEELLQVPEVERITHYLGDYGGHFFNDGVADSQIDAAYEKALEVMGMDSDTFQGDSAYLYRGEIIGRMRDRLLSETLETGTQVLFVATEPYGGPGDFCLRGPCGGVSSPWRTSPCTMCWGGTTKTRPESTTVSSVWSHCSGNTRRWPTTISGR